MPNSKQFGSTAPIAAPESVIALTERTEVKLELENQKENQSQRQAIDVTVVIPTYNGADRLPKVLDKLRSQTCLNNIRWEIIVCDNGSTDDTAVVIRQYQQTWPTGYPLHYRFGAEQGAAFARQYAVENAAGDLIAFLDDDNLPADNWVSEAYRFAQSHPEAGAIGSQIHGQFESELPAELENIKCFLAIIERGDSACRYEPAKKILPPAAGLIVRKQVWLDTVPKRLFLNNKGKAAGLASEDLEAILHIQKAGWDVWYNPDMVIHHDIPDGRLKKDYLITLFRCVGLSCFHIRLLGIDKWKHPFLIPAHIANDIRKLALHRMRHGSQQQLSTTDSCHRERLSKTVTSPFFLLKKAYQDSVQTRDDNQHIDRKQWLAEITHAFENNQFSLYQQPVITVGQSANQNEQSNQNELLLRLNNRLNECVLPSRFLPTAKRYGLMRTIDRWVIRQLFQQVEQQKHQPSFVEAIDQLNGSPLYSINLSADSVKDSGLAALIARDIAQVGLPPGLFCFEISAQIALSLPKETGELMAALHRMGCKITLDNVTVGHVAKRTAGRHAQTVIDAAVDDMVNHLPLDFIKLHTETMKPTQSSEREWTQLRKTMQKGSVQAIAQGIESQAGLDAVQAQGIRYAQGYQIGRPRPL